METNNDYAAEQQNHQPINNNAAASSMPARISTGVAPLLTTEAVACW